jgi:hypothetical protein
MNTHTAQAASQNVSTSNKLADTNSSHDIDACLELQDRTDDIEEELASLQQHVTDIDKDYGAQRATLKNFIDEELRHLHGEKRKKLLDQMAQLQKEQKEEEQEYTAKYAKLKAEHEENRSILIKRREMKAQEKKDLEVEAERKFMDIPKDDLWKFVRAQNKQKRRKTKGEKAGHDDKL